MDETITETVNNNEGTFNSNGQIPSTPVIKEKKKNGVILKTVALILACAIVGGVSGYFGSKLAVAGISNQTGNSTSIKESTGEKAVTTTYVNRTFGKTASQVYSENVNSTVGIATSIQTNYFGFVTSTPASGSGFIVTSDGYVLTNYHVVEGANSITVNLYDGSSYDASLVGYDESNDIAVLKIDAKDLNPVVIGSSNELSIGDTVVAIGNPLGELTFSLTQGVVSALDREITLSSGITMDLIQTDCAINSGNSGGALFNMAGEVVGITNSKYSGQTSSSSAAIENIGFAIPISHVKDIFMGIIEKGYYAKPYIGISVSEINSEIAAYGLPEGAAVKSVTKDSPAEKAGIKANDIITAADGNEIKSYVDLTEYIGGKSIGDNIVLTVYRQGESLEITVTVGEQKQSSEENTETSGATPKSNEGHGSYGGQFPGFPFEDFGFGNNF